MARTKARLRPRGSDHTSFMSSRLVSSPRSIIDHMVLVKSAPRSGWLNSQATAATPSAMNRSRNAAGSLSSRRRSRSSWWWNAVTSGDCSRSSTSVRVASSSLAASRYRCRSAPPAAWPACAPGAAPGRGAVVVIG